MMKYAIELTNGNRETIVETFEDKDAAMEFGKSYFANLPKGGGIVSCIAADFDENGKRTGNAESIHHVWY